MSSGIESMSISEFKTTCLRVIEQVRKTGRQLIITKNGEPAALISPPPPVGKNETSYCGVAKGQVFIEGDIVSPLDVQWEVLKPEKK